MWKINYLLNTANAFITNCLTLYTVFCFIMATMCVNFLHSIVINIIYTFNDNNHGFVDYMFYF